MIAIPSYMRWHKPIKTIEQFPEHMYPQIKVFVRDYEVEPYRKVVPKGVELIKLYESTDMATTRNEMLKHMEGDWVVLDDDLSFREYNKLERGYRNASPESCVRLYRELRRLLNAGFIHASVAAPVVGARHKGKLLHNTRYYAVTALSASAFKKMGITYRTKCMSDFDVNLRLLRLGFPSAIITKWILQTSANDEGGCSVYRTTENHLQSAKRVAKFHKGFVKIVRASAWKGMDDRFDVRISWDKAYKSAKTKRIPMGYNGKI